MTSTDLIQSINDQLNALNLNLADLPLRQKVLRLAEILRATRTLNVMVVRADGCDAASARERIRLYLIQNCGVAIDATELEVVSGISEYGRRVRELRVQDGYRILTGANSLPEDGTGLAPTEYLLIDPNPDITAAHRWHVANRIRRESGGAKSRLLRFFQANVNQILTSDELAYVSGNAREFGRRTRELRTEEGYAVATRFTGRPDLRSGEYVLESVDRVAEPHDRHIPEEVQRHVYARDANTCQNCGWVHDDWTRADPRLLELHHIVQHVAGGENLANNLVVVYNRCHDDVHAGRIKTPLPTPAPGP